MYSNTFILLITFLAGLYYWFHKKRNDYWKKRGINGPTSLPLLGTLHRFLYRPVFAVDFEDFKKYGNVYGMFEGNTPKLVVNDVELIKRIAVKDSHIFVDRTHEKIPLTPVLQKLLTILRGEDWRKVRKMLTPAFTSGKLRKMYPLMCDSVDSFLEVLNEAASNRTEVDMKQLWECYTLDVIARCCFAINVNSYKDPNCTFVRKVSELNQFRVLPLLAYFLIPDIVYKLLRIERKAFEKVEFFIDTINHVIDERKKSKEDHNDFLQMLIEAVQNEQQKCDNEAGKETFDRDMVVAQSILFLLAGYETTALLLTFSSYVLAIEPDIQQKLYDEICAIPSSDGHIDYESLMSAPYLNAFVCETLRFFPPALRFERASNSEYSIPEYDLKLPTDSTIVFSPYCIHRNPLHYSEPDVFNPTRFLPGNIENINQYSFVPFGLGPRNCIGNRFALLEAKLVLAKTLLKYRILTSNSTQIPLKFPNGPLLTTTKCIFATFDVR